MFKQSIKRLEKHFDKTYCVRHTLDQIEDMVWALYITATDYYKLRIEEYINAKEKIIAIAIENKILKEEA